MAINFALASQGSTATATSSAGSGFPVSSVIDGFKHTNNAWTSGGGWSSAAPPPQAVEVAFGQIRQIDTIDIFTLAYKDKTLTKEDLLKDAVAFLEELGQKVTPGALRAEGEDYADVAADVTGWSVSATSSTVVTSTGRARLTATSADCRCPGSTPA